MRRRTTRSKRTYILLHYTTLYRSTWRDDLPLSDNRRGAETGRADLRQGYRQTVLLCRLGEVTGRKGRPTTHSRSEEHTSELQSLMRISYAVFCLQKKIFPLPINIYHSLIPHTLSLYL